MCRLKIGRTVYFYPSGATNISSGRISAIKQTSNGTIYEVEVSKKEHLNLG